MNEQYRGFNLYGGSEPTAKPRSAASFSGNQLDPSLISTAMEPSQSSLPWGRRLL
jgi:hypothetical protein